jgi:hypothetical protein
MLTKSKPSSDFKRMKKYLTLIAIIVLFTNGYGQSEVKLHKYFLSPVIIDSSSVVLIPIHYKPHVAWKQNLLWDNHCSNILIFDTKTDSVKKLFKEDTFISRYNLVNYPRWQINNSLYSSRWLFFFVKTSDYNKNGKLDPEDPYIIYVSDRNGDGLKPITPLDECALSIDISDEQGFAIIQMQRDSDHNNEFSYYDECYFVRLDLNTLTFGKKVEQKDYIEN